MSAKIAKLIIGIVALCLLVGSMSYFFYFNQIKNQTDNNSDREVAITRAQEIFKDFKTSNMDLSNGPCIAEDLIPDWVADLAHNPRQAVDNLFVNQCQSYLAGGAHHFVELDLEGNFIRAN